MTNTSDYFGCTFSTPQNCGVVQEMYCICNVAHMLLLLLSFSLVIKLERFKECEKKEEKTGNKKWQLEKKNREKEKER